MIRQISLPVTDKVRKDLGLPRDAVDGFWIASGPAEFLDFVSGSPRDSEWRRMLRPDNNWSGNIAYDEAVARGHNGDLTEVAASEPLLEQLEALFPAPTARRRIVDDVAGAFPNVQAFIAGTPLTMRRKARNESEFAPLAIVVNLMASSGCPVAAVRRRGVAILALVRALSARRPVELYVGITCAGKAGSQDSANVYFKIDTAPLDLARAAFFLVHPAVLRGLSFDAVSRLFGTDSSIPWAWNAYGASRDHFQTTIARAFPHVSEVLAVPGMTMHDTYADPVAWVAEHVRQYGEAELDLAAAA